MTSPDRYGSEPRAATRGPRRAITPCSPSRRKALNLTERRATAPAESAYIHNSPLAGLGTEKRHALRPPPLT